MGKTKTAETWSTGKIRTEHVVPLQSKNASPSRTTRSKNEASMLRIWLAVAIWISPLGAFSLQQRIRGQSCNGNDLGARRGGRAGHLQLAASHPAKAGHFHRYGILSSGFAPSQRPCRMGSCSHMIKPRLAATLPGFLCDLDFTANRSVKLEAKTDGKQRIQASTITDNVNIQKLRHGRYFEFRIIFQFLHFFPESRQFS